MGNCLVNRKQHILSFDIFEVQLLENIFQLYVNRYINCRRNNGLSREAFEDIFLENKEFAQKLFNFLEFFSNCKTYIPKEPLFILLESLVKDNFNIKNSNFKNFDRVELFTLISLENNSFLTQQLDLHILQVSYLDAINIVNYIQSIGRSGTFVSDKNELIVKAMVDTIYKNQNGTLEWTTFVLKLKYQMVGLPHIIRAYFIEKFMHIPIQPKIPILLNPSYILSQDTVFQLQLSAFNTKLNGSKQLKLIYSNLQNEGGFAKLVQSLCDSQLPTLILIQHESYFVKWQDRSIYGQPHVFGAISNHRWSNTAQSLGDEEDCLFSLYPEFVIRRYNHNYNAEKNYCFLNYRHDLALPQGIGFGGTKNGRNCRIWIDEDFENQSYVKSNDQSYEPGSIVAQHITQLKINVIEVWGIVNPTHEGPEFIESVKQEVVEQFQMKEITHLDNKFQENNKQDYGPFYWSNNESYFDDQDKIRELTGDQNKNDVEVLNTEKFSFNRQSVEIRLPQFSNYENSNLQQQQLEKTSKIAQQPFQLPQQSMQIREYKSTGITKQQQNNDLRQHQIENPNFQIQDQEYLEQQNYRSRTISNPSFLQEYNIIFI